MYTKVANVPKLIEAGIDLFLKHIIQPPIKSRIVSAISTLLRIERDGHPINRSAVTSAVMGCVDVLLQLRHENDTLSVYEKDLEPFILKETEGYYRSEGDRLLETCDASEFLRRVRSLLTRHGQNERLELCRLILGSLKSSQEHSNIYL